MRSLVSYRWPIDGANIVSGIHVRIFDGVGTAQRHQKSLPIEDYPNINGANINGANINGANIVRSR